MKKNKERRKKHTHKASKDTSKGKVILDFLQGKALSVIIAIQGGLRIDKCELKILCVDSSPTIIPITN